MTETRQEIISLIEPLMEKELSEGCLIKSKKLSLYPEDEAELGEILIMTRFHNQGNTNIKRFKVMNSYTEELENFEFEDCISYKIIGHYDITAVLKYIQDITLQVNIGTKTIEKHDCSVYLGDEGQIVGSSINGDFDIGTIPNKPLHLYTEEEDFELLKLLRILSGKSRAKEIQN